MSPDDVRAVAAELAERLTGKPDWWDRPATELSAEHFRSPEYLAWDAQWQRATTELVALVPDLDDLSAARPEAEKPSAWRTDADELICIARIVVARANEPDEKLARQLARGASAGIPPMARAYRPEQVAMALEILELERARLERDPDWTWGVVSLDEAKSYLVRFEQECRALA